MRLCVFSCALLLVACGGLEGPTDTGTDPGAPGVPSHPGIPGVTMTADASATDAAGAKGPDPENGDDGGAETPDTGTNTPDATPPPFDAGVEAGRPDASPQDAGDDRTPPSPVPPGERACGRPTSSAVLFTDRGQLRDFDLESLAVGPAVTVACNAPGIANSLGIDSTGTAFMAFQDGSIQLVSTKTGACAPSPFTGAPTGSFSAHLIHNSGQWGETLYISNNDGSPATLYRVDQRQAVWTPTRVGSLGQGLSDAELAGDDAGNAYALDVSTGVARIFNVDKTTGAAIGSPYVTDIPRASSWSFLVEGGVFYVFIGNDAWKYTPGGAATKIATFRDVIVGASLFGCAP
jgi:hypothetical protein